MKQALIIIGGLAIMALINWIFPVGAHKGSFWQQWPGGYALFGFVFCLALIFCAKALGRLVLKKGDPDD